jgi:hypothetical protein
MTIYSFDLMRPEAMKRFPSVYDFTAVCISACHLMLKHLSETVVFETHRKRNKMLAQITNLRVHLDTLDTVIAHNKAGVSYPITILSFCLNGQTSDMNKYHQDLKMSTLNQVHPRVLFGLVTRLIEGSILVTKPLIIRSHSNSTFEDYIVTVQGIISSLAEIIIDTVGQPSPLVTSAKMRVEYYKQDDSVQSFV